MQLSLIKNILDLTKQGFHSKYNELFNGHLNLVPNEIHIELNENITSLITKPRKIYLLLYITHLK